MKKITLLHFITFSVMISFASVNAVLFTPALPTIANDFHITDGKAQLTMTLFLIGYAVGQLIYAPFANRFGRKQALSMGLVLQIISSLLCALSLTTKSFSMLILGRLLLALGSGVGLKMAFTLVNELYEPVKANKLTAYLMIAFAIMPGLSVAFGGILISKFVWSSVFYFSAFYGVMLWMLSASIPETKANLDYDALKPNKLLRSYVDQCSNIQLIAGGLLMAGASCFVYVFAALAPFLAMDLLHLSSSDYGIANLLPPIGLVIGSIISAKLSSKIKQYLVIQLGILIAAVSSVLMLLLTLLSQSALLVLFMPMVFCYFGLALVFANASSLAMKNVLDKSHGSALMNFINMGMTTVIVLSLGKMHTSIFLMPIVFILICCVMLLLSVFIIKTEKNNEKNTIAYSR